ncbi:MAG TPA: hypothetical protein VGQ95_09975 [Chthoniobacterales bacterium]|nr:hypothetical protein [Chthoniobacterales bacterium]
MLDTVTIKLACSLRIRLPGRQKVSLIPGLKVWADRFGEILEKAEFSLPKLLFGCNGRLLTNQGEIDAALALVSNRLSEIAVVPDLAAWNPRRVDMVWNFELPALPLIMAHTALRVPGILHGATLHNGDQGVSWRGSKSLKMITLYDKARQMRVPGSVLRAEVSLRGKQLLRYLPGETWRSFNPLYRVYRSTLATIPPIQTPAKAATFPEAIGLESREVRGRILARLAHKSSRTFRRYRQRVEAAAAQLERTFSWAEILPEDAPPAAVHVMPRNRARLVGVRRCEEHITEPREQGVTGIKSVLAYRL